MKTLLHCFILLIFFFSRSHTQAQQKSFSIEINSVIKMNYLLYQPENITGDVPLLVFLHGGGESGNDIEVVKKNGPPKLIEEGKEFPFYVLSPQNPYEKGFWDDRAVYELMKKIIQDYPIDSKRIYLAGLSRGGYGAWRLAMNYPDIFAAMVVVCGASAPDNYTKWIKDIPIWIFHGKKDSTVPYSVSVTMAKALEDEGAEVKLTLYPEAGHDAWTETFNNEEVYQWFLMHSKK